MRKAAAILIVLIFVFLPTAIQASDTDPETSELETRLTGSEGRERIEILNQLCLRLTYKDTEKSILYGQEALALSERLSLQTEKGLALLQLAESYKYRENIQQAFRSCRQALNIFTALQDQKRIIIASQKMGEFHLWILNFTESLNYFHNALKLAEKIRDRDEISHLNYLIGRVYLNRDKEEWELALKYTQKALDVAEEAGSPLRNKCIINIGNAYMNGRKYDLAIQYFRQALELYRKKNEPVMIYHCTRNIGYALGKQKAYAPALEYLIRAKTLTEEQGDRNDLANTIREIGEIHRAKREYQEAESCYRQALDLILGTFNRRNLVSLYDELSGLYEEKKEFDKALHYFKLSKAITDAQHRQENQNRFLELQERYEAEASKQKIENLTNKQVVDRMTRNFLILCLALIGGILFFIFKRYLYLFTFWKKQKNIGQYRLLEPLGEGGTGNVYKAHLLKEKSQVYTIKVLKDEMLKTDRNKNRFKNEGIIIDRLNHPNIVRFHERGTSDGRMYIVMEYLQGKTLEEKLLQGRLDLEESLAIMIQVADALAMIHSKGIVHRDLKPANIMLIQKDDQKNFVKILDFGLSKMRHQTRVTQTGVFVGTVNYVAPEQVTDCRYSPASDIYALGVILYEMVSGEKAFNGDSMPAIIEKVLNNQPTDLSMKCPHLPKTLIQLILSAMQKDPLRRPDARQVLETLRELVPDQSFIVN